MLRAENIEVGRVTTEAARQEALEVLSSTYLVEKGWARDVGALFPASDLGDGETLWLLARIDGEAAGVLRVDFAPPLSAYTDYGLEFLDPTLDAEAFLKQNRVAEIGRFAVVPELRGKVMLPAALMRAATMATVEYGHTHFVTDVLEDDPHSPFGFHTRVLGFQVVATHHVGELLSPSRRITLLLDIKDTYWRLHRRNNWFSRFMLDGWQEHLRQQMAA